MWRCIKLSKKVIFSKWYAITVRGTVLNMDYAELVFYVKTEDVISGLVN